MLPFNNIFEQQGRVQHYERLGYQPYATIAVNRTRETRSGTDLSLSIFTDDRIYSITASSSKESITTSSELSEAVKEAFARLLLREDESSPESMEKYLALMRLNPNDRDNCFPFVKRYNNTLDPTFILREVRVEYGLFIEEDLFRQRSQELGEKISKAQKAFFPLRKDRNIPRYNLGSGRMARILV